MEFFFWRNGCLWFTSYDKLYSWKNWKKLTKSLYRTQYGNNLIFCWCFITSLVFLRKSQFIYRFSSCYFSRFRMGYLTYFNLIFGYDCLHSPTYTFLWYLSSSWNSKIYLSIFLYIDAINLRFYFRRISINNWRPL